VLITLWHCFSIVVGVNLPVLFANHVSPPLNKPVIFENAAEIAGVPAHCERSENNAITSGISATCLRKFAARNIAFTLKNVFVVHALSPTYKKTTHIFEIAAKIAVPLSRLQRR